MPSSREDPRSAGSQRYFASHRLAEPESFSEHRFAISPSLEAKIGEKSTQIDPQMRAILRQAMLIGRKPLHTLTPSQARAWLDPRVKILAMKRKEASKIEERKFQGPAGEIPVRIYMPFGKGPFGCLIN